MGTFSFFNGHGPEAVERFLTATDQRLSNVSEKRIMGTFLIIKLSPSIFYLLGEIMRNVPIICPHYSSQIHRLRQVARDSFLGNKADRREPSPGKSLWRPAASSAAYLKNPMSSSRNRLPGIRPCLRHTLNSWRLNKEPAIREWQENKKPATGGFS
jgi:hypothetical protein